MNVSRDAPVAIRPMERSDVDALAAWERHRDPDYRMYDVGPLSRADGDALFRALSEPVRERRPYVALLGERVVAQLVLRPRGEDEAEMGIMVDPALIGRGLGRRILRAFAGYCSERGFRRLGLEVAAQNERAQRAYRAAGFVVRGERRAALRAGTPPIRIIRMETELPQDAFTESTACESRPRPR